MKVNKAFSHIHVAFVIGDLTCMALYNIQNVVSSTPLGKWNQAS